MNDIEVAILKAGLKSILNTSTASDEDKEKSTANQCLVYINELEKLVSILTNVQGNLESTEYSKELQQKVMLIRNAILDDQKIKAYQKAKIEIAVNANLCVVDRGAEVVLEQIYTEDESEALHNLDKAIEIQIKEIIRHNT